MDTKLIVAIIRSDRLEAVEQKLQDIGVERINVSKVKGYGEYRDFFARDWMVEEVRIEVFTKQDEVDGRKHIVRCNCAAKPRGRYAAGHQKKR